MSYFVEDLLEDIKIKSFAPIGQATFDDSDILSIATKEMHLKLVSNLISIREDFFQTYETTSIRENVSRYAIPSRAIGNSLKTVFYVDVNGVESELDLGDVQDRTSYPGTGSRPLRYYFEGDEIVLLPMPDSSTGSLKFQFPANPNALTLTENCAKINSVSDDGTTATFAVNTDLTTSLSVGSYVDFLCVDSPFKLWAYRVQVTSITASTIGVLLTDVQDESGSSIEPRINDYICLSGTSNIPQIPIAFHPVLAQMVVCVLMSSIGDLNKKADAKATLDSLISDAMKLVKNRVETQPQKVTKSYSVMRYFR